MSVFLFCLIFCELGRTLMDVRLDWIGNKCCDVYQSEARQGWNYICLLDQTKCAVLDLFVPSRGADFLPEL